MHLVKASSQALQEAGRLLAEGKIVAFPTETVYGLGANALNDDAVARVFAIKNRPSFDPLIVHIARYAMLSNLITDLPKAAEKLITYFWPGPLTLILKKKSIVSGLVTSGLDTVAVRFPANPIARKLIEYAATPIAAPSANPFGLLSPTNAQHILESLGDKVDYILDGGECSLGVESTVIDVSTAQIRLLRYGAIPLEDIESCIGTIKRPQLDQLTQQPDSPGQLRNHYAPHKKLFLHERGTLAEADTPADAVALCYDKKSNSDTQLFEKKYLKTFILSPRSNVHEAAKNLFKMLHELDNTECSEIHAEMAPDESLGRAINDRLFKASYKGKLDEV